MLYVVGKNGSIPPSSLINSCRPDATIMPHCPRLRHWGNRTTYTPMTETGAHTFTYTQRTSSPGIDWAPIMRGQSQLSTTAGWQWSFHTRYYSLPATLPVTHLQCCRSSSLLVQVYLASICGEVQGGGAGRGRTALIAKNTELESL